MKHYRLISAVTIPMNVDVCWRKNGATVYGFVRLEPGEEYDLPDDDDLLKKSLEDATAKVTYTKSFEETLKKANVSYEVVPPSCRCKKTPTIVFHDVEVYDA